MRVRLLFLPVLACLTLAVGSCHSSSPTDEASRGGANTDDSLVPDSVRSLYAADASRLALRELQKSGSPAEQPVEIPAALTQTFYRALIGVYNLGTSQSDSVVHRYAVHTGGNPAIDQLLVLVDTTAAWAAPWRARVALTGVAAIDSLVSHYQLSITRVTRLSALGMGDMFELRSAGRFNMAALVQRFIATGLVRSAEENGMIGGSSGIAATRQGPAWRLDYLVAWGDCPAGCIYGHVWSFLAFDTGGVRYLGSNGPAVPARPY